MKKMITITFIKKALFVLQIVAVCIFFTSCSKDDSDSSVSFDNSKVVGTWSITSTEGTTSWNWINTGNVLTFNSDGTCSTGFSMENSWKIESGKVCTYYKKTEEPMLIYTLLSVEGSTYRIKVQGTLDEKDLSVIINVNKNNK